MLAFLFSFVFIIQAPDSTVTEKPAHVLSTDSTSTDRYVLIDNIFIIGNKQTRESIILREMSLIRGNRYYAADLDKLIRSDRSKIINTNLFTSVEVSALELADDKIDLVIKVTERWYTFPVPIFDMVDRNLNDWWQNQNRDLSRVNYGVKLYRNNMRGRNETLRLQFQMGYTKQFGIDYKIPYFDKSQRHGMNIEFEYAENKNIAYQTEHHKRIFFDSDRLLRLERRLGLGYQFRNSFYTTHFFKIVFHNNRINDTIAAINPQYYLNGQVTQRYFSLEYDINIENRDVNSYPLHGYKTTFYANKNGIGIFDDIDQFELSLNHSRYIELKKGIFLANYSSVYFSGPKKQPYANLHGLGYLKDYVRGYELYVVEGQRFYLNRMTLKKELFNSRFRMGIIPFEQFRNFPLAIYLKTYVDMGYVENFENYNDNLMLSDRYLIGAGAGIDIVSYYDTVIRLEYSFNREKEAGFFLHLRKEF